jgi:hypothetical protein
MRRWLVLCLLCLLGTTRAAADDTQFVTPLKPGSVLRGRFTQERSLQGFQAPLKSEGTFLVAEGKGVIWKVEKPFATTTVITPAGLVQNAQGAETLRLPASRIPFVAKLYDMLSGTMTGDMSGLKQQFAVRTAGSASDWSLQLTPKAGAPGTGDPQAMPIRELDIAGGQYVKSVDVRRQNGDRDLLTFSDQTLDAPALSADEQALLTGAKSE